MRFDDRLKTVMTQPVGDAHDRTVRWRQLVDLLSRRHDETDPALFEAALTMIQAGMRTVARPIRAATARSIAGRPLDPRLMAIFASDRLEVAAPLLAAASFDEPGWATVSARASADVADFIRSLRGEAAATAPPPAGQEAEPAEADEPAPSIGEMVARMEKLRTRRVSSVAFEPPPKPEPLPADSATAANLFRWECDASGQIGWVEGAPRGALIGRNLPAEELADRRLIRAFADRLPFDDAPLSFPAPALEGEWRLSGIPAFSPTDGRFLGYRGIARRDADEPAPAILAPAKAGDAETLRETIHEIKTPLNAIIGFAEIIDGQYLGPAHRNYRHRAAEIVDQARILLAAIEDLDFAARIQTRGGGTASPAAVEDLFPAIAEDLQQRAAARGVQLRVEPVAASFHFELDRDVAERLVRRLGGAMIDAAAPGEALGLSVREEKGRCAISITRPISTVHLAERQLLDPTFSTAEESEGSRLGLGFALRLVRGLVRLAGGVLRFGAEDVTLLVPGAKG